MPKCDFNKVAKQLQHLLKSLQHGCFPVITLQHGCYPVNLLYIFRTPFYKNTSGGLLLEENPADSISLEFCKFCKNMFYKEDHQTTATENKLEIESSSISRIWGKHKERLIKGDCLSMLLNSLYPIDKEDCQKINVLKGSWQRCNSKYFKSKEHYNKLR